MTRRESEQLKGSLLGESGNDGGARLSPVLTVGLKFRDDEDPVAATYIVLERSGLDSPEALRGLVSIPDEPMICIPSSEVIPTSRMDGYRVDLPFLSAALILGLCSSTCYDPSRPVIWTQASLTRKVRLFSLGGFYASA